MNKPHESDSPGPAGQTAKTLSKRIADCNKFLRTDGAKDQVPAPDGKDIATQLARKARVGHIVHRDKMATPTTHRTLQHCNASHADCE
jgi:hypothetical protein